MESERLAGIISDRDIKRALDPDKASKKKLLNVGGLFFLLEPIEVREIMTQNVVTIGPDLTIPEAAEIMLVERFGALPVVKGDRVLGIVTETDMLCYIAHRPHKPRARQPKSGRTARTNRK
jgi:acetoin utilization protein AcuB